MLKQEIKEKFGVDANTPTDRMSVNLNEGLELMLCSSPSPEVEGVTSMVENIRRYRGAKLDPQVFKPYYYVPIHLAVFGSDEGRNVPDFWNKWWKVDAIDVNLRVHLFTVGEWKVVKKEHVDWSPLVGTYGKVSTWDRFISGLSEFFSSAPGMFLTILAVVVAVLMVVVVASVAGGRTVVKVSK